MNTTAEQITLFFTKDKFLTSYGFACGYVQRQSFMTRDKYMYHEHGIYHVRAMETNNLPMIWETFEKLTDAKKFYKSIKH